MGSVLFYHKSTVYLQKRAFLFSSTKPVVMNDKLRVVMKNGDRRAELQDKAPCGPGSERGSHRSRLEQGAAPESQGGAAGSESLSVPDKHAALLCCSVPAKISLRRTLGAVAASDFWQLWFPFGLQVSLPWSL